MALNPLSRLNLSLLPAFAARTPARENTPPAPSVRTQRVLSARAFRVPHTGKGGRRKKWTQSASASMMERESTRPGRATTTTRRNEHQHASRRRGSGGREQCLGHPLTHIRPPAPSPPQIPQAFFLLVVGPRGFSEPRPVPQLPAVRLVPRRPGPHPRARPCARRCRRGGARRGEAAARSGGPGGRARHGRAAQGELGPEEGPRPAAGQAGEEDAAGDCGARAGADCGRGGRTTPLLIGNFFGREWEGGGRRRSLGRVVVVDGGGICIGAGAPGREVQRAA
jgi:hypothetical protein